MSVYPSPPGKRMAYDIDGTVGFQISGSGAVTQFTQAQLQMMNDETHASAPPEASPARTAFGFLFPQLRNLVGYFIARNGWPNNTIRSVQTSVDTTNGLDGTWSVIQAAWVPTLDRSVPEYRTQIQALTANNFRAIRFNSDSNYGDNLWAVHLYGGIPADEAPDRMVLWHPTLDQPLSTTPGHLDWGDVTRGTTHTRQFRVKNLSPSLTANNVTVALAALTDPTPSLLTQFALSSDGSTYGASLTIPSLGPLATSPVYTIRYASAANAALSVWAARLSALPSYWS